MEEILLSGLSKVKLDLWIALGAYILTVIGWYLARRSRLKADKRRYRANYLIEVIGAIAAGVNRDLSRSDNRNFALGVERAIEKIQFLGTKEQINLASEFKNHVQSKDFPKAGDTLAKLFTVLRDELRSEFRQEPLDPINPKNFSVLRF